MKNDPIKFEDLTRSEVLEKVVATACPGQDIKVATYWRETYSGDMFAVMAKHTRADGNVWYQCSMVDTEAEQIKALGWIIEGLKEAAWNACAISGK